MLYDVDEIYHYGIKRKSGRYPWGSGEKWGKRKNSTSSSNKKKKELTSEQIIESRSVKVAAKNTKKLSDQELMQLANRFQAETKIKELAKKEQKDKREIGKKFLGGMADTSEKLNKFVKNTTSTVETLVKFMDFANSRKK